MKKHFLILSLLMSNFVNASSVASLEGSYVGKHGFFGFGGECSVKIEVLDEKDPIRVRMTSRNDVFKIETKKKNINHVAYYVWDKDNDGTDYFEARYERRSMPLDFAFTDTQLFFEDGSLDQVKSEFVGVFSSEINCKNLIKK